MPSEISTIFPNGSQNNHDHVKTAQYRHFTELFCHLDNAQIGDKFQITGKNILKDQTVRKDRAENYGSFFKHFKTAELFIGDIREADSVFLFSTNRRPVKHVEGGDNSDWNDQVLLSNNI